MALLVNATQEPHFHVTASALAAQREAAAPDPRCGRIVADDRGMLLGTAAWAVQPFDIPDRAWLSLAVHPDHLTDAVAPALVTEVESRVGASGITSLWLPVREDYLGSWPSVTNLDFAEVHRTFGGGFFLDDYRPLQPDAPGDVRITSLAETAGDAGTMAAAQALYGAVRPDKLTAPPTITAAAHELDLEDARVLARASFLALDEHRSAVGLVVAERSSLGAWCSAIGVRADRRRHGLGRALLVHSLNALHQGGIRYLNAAGVRSDVAFLRLLRSLGATIEPDWISFERSLG